MNNFRQQHRHFLVMTFPKNSAQYGFLIVLFGFFIFLRAQMSVIKVHAVIEQTAKPIGNISKFTGIRIVSNGTLEIEPNSVVMQFFAPSSNILFDPIYCLYLIGVCVIAIITKKSTQEELPFTDEVVKLFNLLIGLTILLFVISGLRFIWFNKELNSITNGNYEYVKSIFEFPEFWTLVILFAVRPLVVKGHHLQKKYSSLISVKEKKRIADEVHALIENH